LSASPAADDDAQGQSLEVLWDYELDRLILKEEGWADLAAKGFDPPRQFAAFLHTLRWNCVTATDPNLFQSPFRAGIKIDMEANTKVLILPGRIAPILAPLFETKTVRPHLFTRNDPKAARSVRTGEGVQQSSH
jgi:hypothetical protein